MLLIKGITVKLSEVTQAGTDDFNRPILIETWEDVANVLVGEPSTDDITNSLELHGKHCVYTLGIPKGDTHDWKDKKVQFWGETFRTFGEPTKGIEANIPLAWNTKVKVERFE